MSENEGIQTEGIKSCEIIERTQVNERRKCERENHLDETDSIITLKPLNGQNINELQVNQGIQKQPSLASVNLQECKSNRLIQYRFKIH